HAPGGRVFMIAVADMKDFPEAFGAIAVLEEVLREGDRVRNCNSEICAEVVNAQRSGPDAGEQRVAGGRADRLVAVGVLEEDAAPGEPINVWRLDALVAVATEQRLQVVHTDEQDVGGPRLEDRNQPASPNQN